MKRIIVGILFIYIFKSNAMWYVGSDKVFKIDEKETMSAQSEQALSMLDCSCMTQSVNFLDVCLEIEKGNKDIINAWLSAHGEPDAVNVYSTKSATSHYFQSIFLSAVGSGNPQSVEILLKAGAQPQKYADEVIKIALVNKDSADSLVQMVQLLIEHGAFVGASHLQYINEDNKACLPLLLEKINFKQLTHMQKREIMNDLLGHNPSAEVISVLLSNYSVGLNVKDNRGETLLHTVVRKGSKSLVALCIQHGAHLLRNKKGKTPKDIAKELWGKNDSRFEVLNTLAKNIKDYKTPKYIFSH
jgi:ankyrin repeat protein